MGDVLRGQANGTLIIRLSGLPSNIHLFKSHLPDFL